MTVLIAVIALFLAALFFAWLARRAWRARQAVLRWPGVVVAGLLAALLALAGAFGALGLYRLNRPQVAPPPTVEVVRSPEPVARGERLANLCTGCHSSTGELPLDGGTENLVEGLGTLTPPNLTPGGPLAEWSDGEIIRAIRAGVDRNGRALVIMPSDQYHRMSDADVQALVAYLRSQPAVDRRTPPTELNLIGAILVGAGILPTGAQPPVTTAIAAPNGSPAEYGAYLVGISGCRECHGEDLLGGTPNDFVPAGPNLPAVVSGWSEEEFVRTMRTGVDPHGRSIDPALMPWDDFSAAYGDDELAAIYEYLRALSAGAGPGDREAAEGR